MSRRYCAKLLDATYVFFFGETEKSSLSNSQTQLSFLQQKVCVYLCASLTFYIKWRSDGAPDLLDYNRNKPMLSTI